MARRGRDDTRKEGEKSHNDEPTEKKTDVSSSKTDKSNNKTDSDSTTGSRKELKMTFEKKENSVWPGFPKNGPSVTDTVYVLFTGGRKNGVH